MESSGDVNSSGSDDKQCIDDRIEHHYRQASPQNGPLRSL